MRVSVLSHLGRYQDVFEKFNSRYITLHRQRKIRNLAILVPALPGRLEQSLDNHIAEIYARCDLLRQVGILTCAFVEYPHNCNTSNTPITHFCIVSSLLLVTLTFCLKQTVLVWPFLHCSFHMYICITYALATLYASIRKHCSLLEHRWHIY